jgi:four helix bundle protein
MVERFRDLRVYRDAFRAARQIYEHSSDWPKAERYALTDQIRRSSRAVNANIAEAWRKRLYPNHFVSKLSDADAEAAETRSWLDFALDHGYLSENFYDEIDDRYDKIQGSLVKMMNAPNRWCGPADEVREEQADYFTNGSFPN